MRRRLIVSALVTVLGALGIAGASFKRPVRTSASVQNFRCLDLNGTVTSTSDIPSVVCNSSGGGGELSFTSPTTPAPAPISSPTPATSSVTVTTNHASSQSSSSGNVTIGEHSSSTTSQGRVSNHSSSVTNITITNH